jgi:hypothetical protein
MLALVRVRGIGKDLYDLIQYAILLIYFKGTDLILAKIIREVYVVNNLCAKMLISIDIIRPKSINILSLE